MEQWRLEGSVVGGIAFFVALLLMLLIWMPTAPFFGHLRQGIQIACVSPLMAAPATIIVGTLIWAAIAWSFPTLLIVSLLGGAVILWGELIYLTVVAAFALGEALEGQRLRHRSGAEAREPPRPNDASGPE
jgi:hypothetical protein